MVQGAGWTVDADEMVRLIGSDGEHADDSAALRRALRTDCDPLTGLLDRRAITSRVGSMMASAAFDGGVAVFIVDLDRFRVINDLLGHDAGDVVLAAIGTRLAAVAGQANVGRIGADEFVVVQPCPTSDTDAVAFAEGLRAAAAVPMEVAGEQARVSVSVGVAISGADTDPAVVLQRASMAMHRGREQGRSVNLADAAMAEAAVRDLQLDLRLERAIADGEIAVAHQPIIAADGTVLGTEALVRWPDSGVDPGTVIAVAERAGLIPALAEAVARQALTDLPVLSMAAGRPLQLSINWSAQQLTGPAAADAFVDLLLEHDVDPARICVELTESTAMLNGEVAIATLNALRARGIAVSLDDFGTGYSSFAHLQDLPVDQVKLDRAMVQRAVTGRRGQQVLRGMVQLCRGLDLQVVGEGVETEQERQAVQQAGCHAWQGYLGARPVAAADLGPRIRELASGRGGAPASDLHLALAGVGLVDALVLQHVGGTRWTNLGGVGRGEGWAGIVDVDLADEPMLTRMLASGETAIICHDRPFQVLGPYWATSVAAIPRGDRLVVVGHPDQTLPYEDLESAAGDIADLAVTAVTRVATSRPLTDLLEVLESVRSLLTAQVEDHAAALDHLLALGLEALSCDVGAAWVPRCRRDGCRHRADGGGGRGGRRPGRPLRAAGRRRGPPEWPGRLRGDPQLVHPAAGRRGRPAAGPRRAGTSRLHDDVPAPGRGPGRDREPADRGDPGPAGSPGAG